MQTSEPLAFIGGWHLLETRRLIEVLRYMPFEEMFNSKVSVLNLLLFNLHIGHWKDWHLYKLLVPLGRRVPAKMFQFQCFWTLKSRSTDGQVILLLKNLNSMYAWFQIYGRWSFSWWNQPQSITRFVVLSFFWWTWI